MKKHTYLVLLSSVILFGCSEEPSPSQIPERLSKPIETQCREPHIGSLESGQTSRMRNAISAINSCLENEIKRASVTRLGGDKSQLIIEQSLELLRTGHQRIHWEIATENINCRPTCGTMTQLAHVSAYQELLKDILDKLLEIEAP